MKQAEKRRTAKWAAFVSLCAVLVSLYYAMFIAKAETTPLPLHTFAVAGGGEGAALRVSWNYRDASGADAFILYRSEDGWNYAKVRETAEAEHSYQDTGLSRGKTYFYRLYARQADGSETALSEPVTGQIANYTSKQNVLTNSQFQNGTNTWTVGTAETADGAWQQAAVKAAAGYTGTLQHAGHTYTGQGEAVSISLNSLNQKARTVLYQRALEVVPTGAPVQLSFVWKKNCQCAEGARQSLRIELVRPDATSVTVWKDETVGAMTDYAAVENLDVTPYILAAGTYELRIIAEQETGQSMPGPNEIYVDEVFLDFPRGPKAPRNLQLAVAKEGSALHVSWEKGSADTAGYYLYRSTAENGPYERVNKELIADSSYTDTNLQNGQIYYYYVTAFGAHVESQKSKAVKGVPLFIEALNHPHGAYTENTAACASCHLSHKAKSAGIIKEESETKLCLTCHDGTGSAYDISGEFTAASVSAHPVMQTAAASTGSMTCSTCHNPHAANGSRSTTNQASGSLAGVPGTAVTYGATPFTNPIGFTMKQELQRTTELCFTCHSTNPAAPVAVASTATAKEFHPGNASGHSEALQASGFGAYVNGWTATTAPLCTDCHGGTATQTQGVHSSTHENLLKGAFSAVTKATDKDVLCFSCHNKGVYGGSATANTAAETRFQQKPADTTVGAVQAGRNLHNLWNADTNKGHLGVACAQCHSAVPHSTGQLPALLVDQDDPAPYRSYTTNTNVTIYYPADGAWTKESCATTGGGCHLNGKEEEHE